MEAKIRNYNLDVLKLLLALLVVVHHTPSPFHYYILPVTTCAVPVFFMISGYLIFSGEVTTQRLLKNGFRILRIFFFSVLLYYLFYRYNYGSWYVPRTKDIPWMIFANVMPIGAHLWYLSAYAYVLFLMALLSKVGKLYWLKWLALIAALVYLGFDLWHVANNVMKFLYFLNGFRNFFFTGIPFVALGGIIAQRKPQIRSRYLLPMLIAAVALAIPEITCLKANHIADVYFMTVPLSVLLLLVFLNGPFVHSNLLSQMGQRYSLYIYILHPLFIKLFRPYVATGSLRFWFFPLAVFLLSLLVAIFCDACLTRIGKVRACRS